MTDPIYNGKQPVAWKEFVEYWKRKLYENIDSCTGLYDITEFMLKTALSTTQAIIHATGIHRLP